MRAINRLRIFIAVISCSSFPGHSACITWCLYLGLLANFMGSLQYLCQQLILFHLLLDADHPSEALDSPLKSPPAFINPTSSWITKVRDTLLYSLWCILAMTLKEIQSKLEIPLCKAPASPSHSCRHRIRCVSKKIIQLQLFFPDLPPLWYLWCTPAHGSLWDSERIQGNNYLRNPF